MSLISACCCNGICCSLLPNTAASSTNLIQCLSPTAQNSASCVANDGAIFVQGMGVNCEGQTCILKDVPLGQIIKHCLHTDVCAYDSFNYLSPDGAGWYPNWGCGASSNYTLLANGTTISTHREILWQPIGGTSGFTSVENQMEVACVPFSNLGDEPCYGDYFNHLSTSPAQPAPPTPSSRVYANTLKDRVTGNMTVETIWGTVAFSFVGDIDRAGASESSYYLYATSTCANMLGSVLYTFVQPIDCSNPVYCPDSTFRYGVAGGTGFAPTVLHAPDATHTAYYCNAGEQYSVYLGKLFAGFTDQKYWSISNTGSANGSGYQDATVTFSGGGGSGMTGYAVISGGTISNVIITSQGCGYATAPTCTITSNTGSGATRTLSLTIQPGNAAWKVVLDGLGEGFGSSRPAYTGDLPYCLNEIIYTCLARVAVGDYSSWAVSAGNPQSEREAMIGAPYIHWLSAGNQTFVFRNPTADVSTTTTCGGISHTEPVRSVTIEITGSADWAIGGEALISFPLSTPCDYNYDSRYPTQAAVSGTIEIGVATHDVCEMSRYKIISEYGVSSNAAVITGTGAGATYTTAKTKLTVPTTAEKKRPTIITYDYNNFGKSGATPLKKSYYDAFYVYGNPYLMHDTTGFNKHLDVTQPYSGVAGQPFSVTFLGEDFIGMKKAEMRTTGQSPNTPVIDQNITIATTTTITNTGINLDPANCTTVTVGFPSTSFHRFYCVFLFNNYIDRHYASNTLGQGVFVFGVPTAGNTSVISANNNHNVAYNLDPNQSVYMGGTVQPFKTIQYSRASNETASIVVDGVTILDNPNNDLPNAQLGAGFGANLPGQLMGTVGTQSVVFTTYGGSVTLSRRQAITPKLTAVSVQIFPKSGGTTLTLTGLNLDLLSAFVLVYSSDLKSTCSIVSQTATSVVLTTGALTPTYSYSDPLIATYLLNLVATYASEPLLTWGSQTSYLGAFTFTMVSAPTITSVTPSSNLPIAGGTSVVIVGKHFVHMVSVTFNGVAVTPTINSALQMTCIAPANSAGAGQLVITTLGGSASFAITYV